MPHRGKELAVTLVMYSDQFSGGAGGVQADTASSSTANHPLRWLHSSPLLDLEDTRLRLRVQSLTHLCGSEREKVLALYGFVKRIPFAMPFRMRVHTAREVLDLPRADCTDKATLLVAMLRTVRVPARVRYVTLDPSIYRGLVNHVPDPTRPIVEVFRRGAWVCTDTYIFDAAYFSAARRRLNEHGWDSGFGIHIGGQAMWDGNQHAYVNAAPPEDDPLVIDDHGVFCDALEFQSSKSYRDRHAPLMRLVHSNVVAATMDRAIRGLREDSGFGAAAS